MVKQILSSVLLLVLLLQLVIGALPPGFEDEIFCPAGMRLRDRNPMPRGTGSRLMFLECFNASATRRPRAWGLNIDQRVKDKLLSNGWHEVHEDEPTADMLLSFMMLGSRLDSVVCQLAGLTFI
jgi:hypothetical protein